MSKKRPSSLADYRHNIQTVDPVRPDTALIDRACGLLNAGGVVVFPTVTLYGLAADAWSRSAVEKVRQIKGRPDDKPILILIPDAAAAAGLVTTVPVAAERLMDRFWPGNVTLVFEASARVPSHLISPSGTIGLRVPSHPVAHSLVARLGRPVTGTSANRSGRPACSRVTDLDGDIVRLADMVLDAGALGGGVGSTVVDVTVNPPKVLREGTVRAADILKTAGAGR